LTTWNYGCYDDYTYELYLEEELVEESSFSDLEIVIPELEPGTYHLSIYRNDTLLLKRYNIQPRPDSITSYVLNVEKPFHDPSYKTLSEFESYLGLFYGPSIIDENPFIRNSFGLDFGVAGRMGRYGNNFSVWAFYGFDYTYTAFSKDTMMFPPGPAKYERYSNLNMSLGLFHRISLIESYGLNEEESFALDLGAKYNLPLYFRHAYNYEKRLFNTRGLHQFKNFSALARLSYKAVGITCEYRIFDYVKGDFPEPPRLKLGITLILKE
jgi:hypothetical protein